MTFTMALTMWAFGRPEPHETRMPEVPPPVPPIADDADPTHARGGALYRTAGCVGCHSPPFAGAEHLGGGRDLPTAFGVFYAPNISPDPDVGIGGWTEDDFERAVRRGRAPDGRRYWPTFPYMAYTHLTDEDVHALWVYLAAQPPVATPERARELRPLYRLPGLLGLWRTFGFHRGPLGVEPERGAAWNRGNYLVHAVGYCDQCHTPRGRAGFLVQRHALAGGANPGKGELHPNLTPDPVHGLGGWTVPDLAAFLASGVKPAGEADPHQVMSEKIADSYSWLSEGDRLAIASYLASLPPDDLDPAAWTARRYGKEAVRAP